MGKKNKKNLAGSSLGESSSQKRSSQQKFSDAELQAPRPPPWAKGAAIGHFYREKFGKKKGQFLVQPPKAPCIPLELNQNVLEHIYNILGRISIKTPPFISDIRSGSSKTPTSIEEKYRHIGDSSFKQSFLNSIQGSVYDIINEAAHSTHMSRDEKLDRDYQQLEARKMGNHKYRNMVDFRMRLPAYAKKEEILNKLKHENVLLISGETGCGKTTQVPQFILEESIKKGDGSVTFIVCTQPRRISAISIADRVADERAELVGQSVGYQVRLEKELPRENGSILFCTTGILLQFMRSDPLLTRISHIILDEIHERDTLSDFVITLLKDIVPARPDLKVILMSATLNAEQFSKYFNNCSVVYIPGFTYEVQEYYLEDVIQMLNFSYKPDNGKGGSWMRMKKRDRKILEMEDLLALEPFYRSLELTYSKHTIEQLKMPESKNINNDLIIQLIQYICRHGKEGAILVFLPGWDKIKSLHRDLTERGRFPESMYRIIPLHSLMPTVNQKMAFARPPAGMRKIILATNIAETSITIDDVVYVIDSGKVKIKNFDIENNVSTLKEEWISCANSRQRRGRAGRVQEGVCYHLYPKGREQLFLTYQLPEMMRTRLEEVILQAKILQLGKIAPFLAKVMDPPNPKAVDLSIELLTGMNALDEDENLTPLGFHLANLPVDPQAGKMILLGAMFSCIDPLYSIASSLSFKNAFVVPLGKEQAVTEVKQRLDGGQKSDHLIMAKVMYLWEQLAEKRDYSNREFCYNHFLSGTILEQLRELKDVFSKLMYESNYLPSPLLNDPRANVHSKNLALIKALVCGSLYPNVAVMKSCKRKHTRIISKIFLPENNAKVVLHPKSVNEQYDSFESRFLVYFEKMRSASTFLFDTSMVYPLPLIFFCQKFDVVDDGDNKIIEINSNIRFICSASLAKLIVELRAWLDWLLEFKVSHPGITDWSRQNDEWCILSAITELLTTEHAMYSYPQEGEDGGDSDISY